MKRTFWYLVLSLLLLSIPGVGAARQVIDTQKSPQMLYVISAHSGSIAAGRLVLNEVPLVVYFSDRPYRLAGQLSLSHFVELWNSLDDEFQTDPPNADLSLGTEDGTDNVIVELTDPQQEGSTISFAYRLIKGELPQSFGVSSLFVDAFPTAVNSQVTD